MMNSRYPSVENLTALSHYFSNGNYHSVPLYLQEWVSQVAEDWSQGKSLPVAFQIFDTQSERRARRDFLLLEYAAMLGSSRSLWMKSKFIAKEVEKIRQNRRDISELLKAIDRIARIPGSQKQILHILQNREI
jgi:hypothetical protein